MTIKEVLVSILKKISEEEKAIMEGWANGVFTGPSEYETIQLNSRALGEVDGLFTAKSIIEESLEELDQYD